MMEQVDGVGVEDIDKRAEQLYNVSIVVDMRWAQQAWNKVTKPLLSTVGVALEFLRQTFMSLFLKWMILALRQSQLINTIALSFSPFILMFTFETLYILTLLLLFTIDNGDCITIIMIGDDVSHPKIANDILRHLHRSLTRRMCESKYPKTLIISDSHVLSKIGFLRTSETWFYPSNMLYMNWTIVLLTIAAIRHVLTVRAVEMLNPGAVVTDATQENQSENTIFRHQKSKLYICFTAAHLNSRPYAKLRMMAKKCIRIFFFNFCSFQQRTHWARFGEQSCRGSNPDHAIHMEY